MHLVYLDEFLFFSVHQLHFQRSFELIEEAAELIIEDFVKNVEANLSVEEQEPNKSTHEVQTQASTSDPVNQSGGSNDGLSLLRVIWAVFKGYFSKHKTK